MISETDYTELRRLARNSAEEDGWHNARFLEAFIDEDDAPVFNGDDADYIAAASPSVILSLLDELEALRAAK